MQRSGIREQDNLPKLRIPPCFMRATVTLKCGDIFYILTFNVSPPTATSYHESSKQRGYRLDRVLALSDGVFAFAVTLLVLDLVVPALPSGASSIDLWQGLSKEYLSFINYILSFFIAGTAESYAEIKSRLKITRFLFEG